MPVTMFWFSGDDLTDAKRLQMWKRSQMWNMLLHNLKCLIFSVNHPEPPLTLVVRVTALSAICIGRTIICLPSDVYICMKLHGSKVSHESDLCNVPYNRPVSVRSFVKNVKSLCENQHNYWTVQDNLMKLHRLTQLVKMCVVGKNEKSCSFILLVICPLI